MIIKNVKIGEGIPKVCVPVQGKTSIEISREIDQLDKLNMDIIEWRADCFDEIQDTDKVLSVLRMFQEKQKNTPLLFTFRSKKEGGNKEIRSTEYQELLIFAMKTAMIDMVDIELSRGEEIVRNLVAESKDNQVVSVVSSHDFEKTPSKDEMESKLITMIKIGADIPKLAVMPLKKTDVIELLGATVAVKEVYENQSIVTMAMGELGVISRIAGEAFGSAITFGSGAKASAPGQIECNKLHQLLENLHATL